MSALILTAINSFAGPEDHVQNQVCYRMKTEQIEFASAYTPKEICIENLTIDTNSDKVYVVSYFMPEIFKDLKVTSVVRKNEDFFRFNALNRLADQAQTATNQSVDVDLTISGLVDNNGIADISDLKVSVKQKTETYPDDTITETIIFDYVLN